jgi:hypothetical protein
VVVFVVWCIVTDTCFDADLVGVVTPGGGVPGVAAEKLKLSPAVRQVERIAHFQSLTNPNTNITTMDIDPPHAPNVWSSSDDIFAGERPVLESGHLFDLRCIAYNNYLLPNPFEGDLEKAIEKVGLSKHVLTHREADLFPAWKRAHETNDMRHDTIVIETALLQRQLRLLDFCSREWTWMAIFFMWTSRVRQAVDCIAPFHGSPSCVRAAVWTDYRDPEPLVRTQRVNNPWVERFSSITHYTAYWLELKVDAVLDMVWDDRHHVLLRRLILLDQSFLDIVGTQVVNYVHPEPPIKFTSVSERQKKWQQVLTRQKHLIHDTVVPNLMSRIAYDKLMASTKPEEPDAEETESELEFEECRAELPPDAVISLPRKRKGAHQTDAFRVERPSRMPAHLESYPAGFPEQQYSELYKRLQKAVNPATPLGRGFALTNAECKAIGIKPTQVGSLPYRLKRLDKIAAGFTAAVGQMETDGLVRPEQRDHLLELVQYVVDFKRDPANKGWEQHPETPGGPDRSSHRALATTTRAGLPKLSTTVKCVRPLRLKSTRTRTRCDCLCHSAEVFDEANAPAQECAHCLCYS